MASAHPQASDADRCAVCAGGVAAAAPVWSCAQCFCLAHLACAVGLLLLLELGVEVMIKYEGVGREGYHSLYRWYRGYEATHFPDPQGLRSTLSRLSLGLYPAGERVGERVWGTSGLCGGELVWWSC